MTQKRNQNPELSDSIKIDFNTIITLNECFSDIKFYERDHKYTINEKLANGSVSAVIKEYEKGFDASGTAQRIAKREGKTTSEVLEEWDFKKEYACHKGSEFHLFVENFLERKKIGINKEALLTFMVNQNMKNDQKFIDSYYEDMAKLICNFLEFYKWWSQDHILIKSEFVIGDKESKICGTIDNLSYNKTTGEFCIFDYKTNKKIKMDNPYGENYLSPFQHIPNCEYSKYSIQLHLYKEIFERNTPYKIGYMGIIWVAGEKNYELYKPSDYSEEAKQMLNIISKKNG
jgi:ATP-dependent exoDNAse (exonuclease V) beta subunit